MKKFLVFILCLTLAQATYAQRSNAGSTKWSFGLSMDAMDQFTPEIDGFQSFKTPMDLGIRAFTWYNPIPSLAVELGIGTNGLRTQPIESPLNEKNLHYFNVDAGLVYKFNNGYILKEDFPVAPYLSAKVRGTYMDLLKSIGSGEAWGVGIPLGGGINWGVGNQISLQTGVQYTIGVTDNYDNNLIWTFGFITNLGASKEAEVMVEPVVEPIPEPVVLDTDGDGVIDSEDDCPEVAGLAKFKGCPDSDGDGIADADDNCPDTKGLLKFKGCPDTDGDGITDADDECPKKAGVASLKGCPVADADNDGIPDADDKCPKIPGTKAAGGCPDADGDGVVDGDDKCPTEAGLATNKGCPAIEQDVIDQLAFAAQNIQFETGSAVIKTSSFSILDNVASILKEYPNYYVSVGGHTDNVGADSGNMILSEKRARAAASFLISKGIAANRVSSTGYGETMPIADNGTAAGRAQNRRVVFNLFLP